MNTRSNTKKLIMNALLLAIGALLHQITPILGLPMQPDFALAMLFIIMILNNKDYKTTMVSALITGIFTAMTTKFPGGQIPNILDKVITTNIIYLIMFVISNVKFVKKLENKKREYFLSAIIFPLGTLISGVVFLGTANIIVGLPAPFEALLVLIVLPAAVINLVAGIFLYKIVCTSLNRATSLKR